MKLFHISDLHLGRRVCERSLIEDQKDILAQILEAVISEKPDAVMIAGDIYDRSVPSEEAVELFDEFLTCLSELEVNVLIISGNHDSAERLGFGGRIMCHNGIYISPEFNRKNYADILRPVILNDGYGEVNFYLLPFITPSAVRAARECSDISDWTDAVKAVVSDMNVDASKRNVIIAHQFVTGASVCDSETFSVGGADNVAAEAFAPFDYAALGHLHGKQSVSKDTVRYSGTPLKYSFSEVSHKKSITVVELKDKGSVDITELPLDKPLHEWRVIRGKFEEVTAKGKSEEYIEVVLTDEEERLDAMGILREYFPNIMKLSYDNPRKRDAVFSRSEANAAGLSPAGMFAEFYKQQRGIELNEAQMQTVSDLFQELQGG